MILAAKKKMPLFNGIVALWIILFLAAGPCLPQTRLWNFKTTLHSVSAKISGFHSVVAQEKQVICGYDVSEIANPGIGQAADIRDLTAAFNAGRTEGWNVGTSLGVMAAGLAFVPLVGDVGKAGVKALHGSPVWQVGKHSSMPTPRPAGTQSHHGVNSVWMEANIPGYKASNAPAVLMRNEPFHNATRGIFNRMRVELAARQGVSPRNIDWSQVQPGTAWRLAEEQFDAAGVPLNIRAEYFKQLNQYLNSIKNHPNVP